MYSNPSIKRSVAGILLLLFAVSIVPKQLLHDAVTGHKHSYIKLDGSVNVQASKNGFQCNWSNDVVESPFTDEPSFQLDHPGKTYSHEFNIYILTYYSAHHFFSSLRGPPARA
ncbi:MAG TPA: hypothetical protein VFI06_10175 [Chitinophagaceae bacterium]|nr:hypothetical protein [Chitinophagaceae bacterium]